jgi:hypothetical protein
MARVLIQRSWPDGDVLTISIKVADSFPDVVREGVRAAIDAYTEALGVTMADTDSDE